MVNVLKVTVLASLLFIGGAQAYPAPVPVYLPQYLPQFQPHDGSVEYGKVIGGLEYKPGTEEAAKQSVMSGNKVVAYFTADWCVYCGVFKKTVLENPAVVEALKGTDRYVVDLTRRDDPRWAWVRQLGGTGIPFVVVYNNGKLTAVVNPSADQIIKAVNG